MTDGFDDGWYDQHAADRPCNWCSMRALARRHPDLVLSAPFGDNVTASMHGRHLATYARLPARCACDEDEWAPDPWADPDEPRFLDAIETTVRPVLSDQETP